MIKTEQQFQNQAASIRNLEAQIGQIANTLTERTQGTLPSNTETNPLEHVKAITLRDGKQYNPPPFKKKTSPLPEVDKPEEPKETPKSKREKG